MKGTGTATCSSENHAVKESFDVERIRRDFPLLAQKMRGKPLVYLDNAATTPKPQAVVDAIGRFYREDCANIHRGLYELSERATRAYEGVRERVRSFINAADASEIVFVRGTTEAINLVAHSYGLMAVKAGDEIVVSHMEHHSNIVPWQLLCERSGARLRVVPLDDRGELEMEAYARILGPRTRLVALTHVSNVLGTINPVADLVELAHRSGARVLIDGAQGAPHLPVDVRKLRCDFYAFSGHKIFGPTGVGVLYGRRELLDAMPPYQGGGDMISSVTFERTTYKDPPEKFEAGTPHIAGVIGLGEALRYVEGVDRQAAWQHEARLLDYATQALGEVRGLRMIGTAAAKAGVISFSLADVHPHDIATILDDQGIAVRAGHHCAQPLMERFGLAATVRASLAFFNTTEEIDALVAGLKRAREVMGA